MEPINEKDYDKHLMIKKWREGGKSMVVFCREENISYYSFQYWQRKLTKEKKPISSSRFIKIKPLPQPKVNTVFCELLSANGHRLIFYDFIEVSFLKQLL